MELACFRLRAHPRGPPARSSGLWSQASGCSIAGPSGLGAHEDGAERTLGASAQVARLGARVRARV